MPSIDLFAYKGCEVGNKDYLYTKLLDNPPNTISVDIETKSLTDRTIIGIGIGLSPTEALYVPVHSDEFYAVVNLLSDPYITKLFHNGLKFDLIELAKYNPYIDSTNFIDTMLLCKMEGLPEELASISDILGRRIGRISDILPKRATMDQLPDDVVANKCCDDVLATFMVYEKLWPDIDQQYFLNEMKLVPILMKMSRRGIKLDQQRRQKLEDKLSVEVDYYRSIAEAQGFNPASPQQVAHILMQRGSRIPVTRKFGKYSACVDEEVLKKLDDPLAALVLNFRKVSKLLSTYILPYKGQDRAYTRFHLNAATGRISSTERNLQNVPPGEWWGGQPTTAEEELTATPGPRTMMIPDGDEFTDFDNSQQELRTLAYISQDKAMLDIYERGLDLHQETSNFMGVPRKICKNVNFSMIYGATDSTIAETAGISSLAKAHELGVIWGNKFPQAWQWIHDIQKYGLQHGHVKTIGGRKLWMPTNEGEEDIKRKASNYPIQGSAAEITKKQMLLCDDKGYDMVMQVHDELMFEGFIEEDELRGLGLETCGAFKSPIEIRRYSRWQ